MTRVNSENNVDVDGMARHILDVRQVVDSNEEEGEHDDERIVGEHRYPSRARAPPSWLGDYVLE